MLGFLRRASLRGGAGASGDPQAEIAAMLDDGGDAWTFDVDETSVRGVVPMMIDTASVVTGHVGNAFEYDDSPPSSPLARASTGFDDLLPACFSGSTGWTLVIWARIRLDLPDAGVSCDIVEIRDDAQSLPVILSVNFTRTATEMTISAYAEDAVADRSASIEPVPYPHNDEWTMIGVTFAGREMSLYLNDEYIAAADMSGTTSLDFSAMTGYRLKVGEMFNLQPVGTFQAADEAILVAGAMTAEQIAWLYNDGAGRSMGVFESPA